MSVLNVLSKHLGGLPRLSIGIPSYTSAVGAAGNLGHICWRTISKAAMNATGLKLSPCGTPTFDSKGLPITSLTCTLNLMLDSRVVAIYMTSLWLPFASWIDLSIKSLAGVSKTLLYKVQTKEMHI